MSFFVALSPYNILQLFSHILVQAIIDQTKSSNCTSVHEYNVYISNCFLYAYMYVVFFTKYYTWILKRQRQKAIEIKTITYVI